MKWLEWLKIRMNKVKEEQAHESTRKKTRDLSGHPATIVQVCTGLFVLYYFYTAGFGAFSIASHQVLFIMFGFLLVFIYYPATRRSPVNKVTMVDLLLIVLAVVSVGYYVLKWDKWIVSYMAPSNADILFGAIIIILSLKLHEEPQVLSFP